MIHRTKFRIRRRIPEDSNTTFLVKARDERDSRVEYILFIKFQCTCWIKVIFKTVENTKYKKTLPSNTPYLKV